MNKLKEDIKSVVNIYKSGDLLKSENLTKELITNNPKVAFLYNLLGVILAQQQKNEEAMQSYEQGIKIDPNFGMIYNNIGLLLFKKKNIENISKAKKFYQKAISLDEKISEPHNNLGNLYDFLNKNEEAIECYKHAIKINPNFSYAHHNLASAYVSIGNFDYAKKHFKKSIKLNPNFTVTHRSLSRITKYTDKNEHFIELKKIYKNINKNDRESKIEIGYSLGKAYEDTKNFEKSFFHYNEANSLQRKKINFTLKNEVYKFKNIKNLYKKKIFDEYKNYGCLDFSPIFIIGMPRSFTTLTEQILSSHPKVYAAEEVEFIPELIRTNFKKNELSLIGLNYINKMKNISKNSDRTTDKLPTNFLHLGFIKLILPKSKIIHCIRNPKDNCLSIFKNQFSSGKINFAYDMKEIVEYYNLYSDLMKYWNNLLPNFIYNIKYEDLISNTKNEIQRLLKYCDLEWNVNCLDFYKNKRPVKTASDAQVRNKIYSSSINSWENYKNYLDKYFNKLKN
jgi:tetratricopeptide (TPR) repeat protein